MTEVAETDGPVIDPAESGDAVRRPETHLAAERGVGGVERRQPRRRIESVDGFHEVEDGPAHDGLVETGGDEARMRHVGGRQGGEHSGLPPQGIVALRPEMRRRPAKDIVATPAGEAEQHVLGAARERLDALEGAAGQSLPIHPGAEDGEVHERRIDAVVGHGLRS